MQIMFGDTIHMKLVFVFGLHAICIGKASSEFHLISDRKNRQKKCYIESFSPKEQFKKNI